MFPLRQPQLRCGIGNTSRNETQTKSNTRNTPNRKHLEKIARRIQLRLPSTTHSYHPLTISTTWISRYFLHGHPPHICRRYSQRKWGNNGLIECIQFRWFAPGLRLSQLASASIRVRTGDGIVSSYHWPGINCLWPI